MFHLLARALIVLLLGICALPALAAIPAAERQTLIDLYISARGDVWRNNTGWKTAGGFSPAGTECGWHGVKCDAGQTRVERIRLGNNQLAGSLPATLNHLKALTVFSAIDNQLTGQIPSLAGLTALREFYVGGNQLTGAIPSLTGLSALMALDVDGNQLTGNIPSLAGLAKLRNFYVYDNRLTGPPPATPAGLEAHGSRLCPNNLSAPSPTDVAWNAATGAEDWHQECQLAPRPPSGANR
jgi:Leucine-rich repeat (LRR) protein